MKARNKVLFDRETTNFTKITKTIHRDMQRKIFVFSVSSVVDKNNKRICRGMRNYEIHENYENASSRHARKDVRAFRVIRS